MDTHYLWQDNTLFFNVLLQPKASRNALIGIHGNAVKICITSPPVDGKANKQLIQFLSKLFHVKKSDITLVSGEHSRQKRISVCNPSQFPEVFSE